jgi:hypothetical protein
MGGLVVLATLTISISGRSGTLAISHLRILCRYSLILCVVDGSVRLISGAADEPTCGTRGPLHVFLIPISESSGSSVRRPGDPVGPELTTFSLLPFFPWTSIQLASTRLLCASSSSGADAEC